MEGEQVHHEEVCNCNKSIEVFKGILLLSLQSDCGNKEDDGNEEEAEEPYAETEMVVVQASMNVMKCSKNVLNLVLAMCKGIGNVTICCHH